jgi:hypothetical protein
LRNGGSGSSERVRLSIAALSNVFLRNGARTRCATPTSPVGEKMMKPTNRRPKYNSQFAVQMDRNSRNRM